jgi:hypothetical protein
VLLEGKGHCSGTHFGNNLLRPIHSQTGHLGQPLHLVLTLAEQIRYLLIELPKSDRRSCGAPSINLPTPQ